MSGECSFFRFCLRGNDSLASKWIAQKRKVGKLREDGANIYSISDYIHHVFCFEKLYGTEYTSNMLFNRIIEANILDKNHIVKFDEEIVIPFSFSPRTYKKPSFDELAKEVKNEPVADFKLGDSLDENEIKEMLINTYHINYDIRNNENIADKTYDEIIREGFLDFKDDAELSFFLPYIFEISTKKVVESSVETPVEISLTESAVQPEVVETAVEGYFYVEATGEYAGKNGNSEDCYVLNDGINIFQDLNNVKYTIQQVRKLNITHEQFNQICGVIHDEDNASFEIMIALTQTSYNAVNLSKPGLKLSEKSKYVANLLFNTGYSSVSIKKELKDTDKSDTQKLMRKALIYVLLEKSDYSNGAIRWDGIDFLIHGKKHVKANQDGGISITKALWNEFVTNWLPNDRSVAKYKGKEYNHSDCANNIPFISPNLMAEDKKKEISTIKTECTNLWKVTETLFETEGTGKWNKGNILNKATMVIGRTIFWGTNKQETKNKSYVWKYLLDSNYFKI